MSILKNTTKLCIFSSEFNTRTHTTDFFEECFKKQAFKDISSTTDELSIGWINLSQPLSNDFSNQLFKRENYIAASMRVDERKIKPNILKLKVGEKCNLWLQKNPGKRRVPKDYKETVTDKIKNELLRKTEPDTKVVDVVIDLSQGNVYLFTTSAKEQERFLSLFHATFNSVRIALLSPFDIVSTILKENSPDDLTAFKDLALCDPESAYLQKVETMAWFGRDFFKWLVFQTLESDSVYAIENNDFVAFIDQKIKMQGSDDGVAIQKMTITGPQSLFSEVKTAFSRGKGIDEGNLTLEKNDKYWLFQFVAETFFITSLKTPALPGSENSNNDQGEEEEDTTEEDLTVFYDKIDFLEQAIEMFHAVLLVFTQERLSKSWPSTNSKIDNYFKEKGDQ